jgi:Kef-type K+ transport system membrane component KefB
MNDQIEPADAAGALSEIGRRREQVIRRAMRAAFPVWYWWSTAVLMIALAASVESRRGVVLGIGITVFVAGGLITSVHVSRAARAAPLRRGLDSQFRETLIGLAAFVAVLVGVMLATLLSLKAAGVPYPATISATVTAVVFAAGGQTLMRYLTAILVRRSGSQR